MASTATNHWKLGLFVVGSIATALGLLFWLGAQRFSREAFPIVTYFDESVQGLDIGSPVKFRGVTMGTVANITLGPDHRHVQVRADIYADAVRSLGISGVPNAKSGPLFMPETLRVQLAAAGITGVKFLEVDFFDPDRYPPPPLPFAEPPNYVASAPSTLRSLEQAALEFANRLPALGEQTTGLLAESRDTLAEGRATLAEGRTTLGSMRHLADELRGADGAVNRLVVRLESATTTFESAVHESQPAATTSALRDASTSVNSAATGASNELSELRVDLRASLVALRETLDSIRSLADSLDRDPSILVRGRRVDDAVPNEAK